MKKWLATAAFLLVSTAAQAQYTFQYGGYTIRVDPDRGTVSVPGVYDNSGHRSKRAKTDQDVSPKAQNPQQVKVNPQSVDPAPAAAATSQTAVPAETSPQPPAATTIATNPPAEAAVAPSPPPAAPAQQGIAPAVTAPLAPPAPAVAIATPAPSPEQRPAPAPAIARDPNSPLGVWLTEEKEGKVRIESCGSNLCGYSVDSKSNQNGEQVLTNMKPGKDRKWTGRIVDPNTGTTYDSTIALQGPDMLRVRGCAFGGMFCGGQTWTRVN